jgi:hypothetical protein
MAPVERCPAPRGRRSRTSAVRPAFRQGSRREHAALSRCIARSAVPASVAQSWSVRSTSTRLLNTPDIGRLTACVDSLRGNMLAGLSKCPIFKYLLVFGRTPCWQPTTQATANPLLRARADSAHSLLFNDAGLQGPTLPARLSITGHRDYPIARPGILEQLPAERAAAPVAAPTAGLPSALSMSPIEGGSFQSR